MWNLLFYALLAVTTVTGLATCVAIGDFFGKAVGL